MNAILIVYCVCIKKYIYRQETLGGVLRALQPTTQLQMTMCFFVFGNGNKNLAYEEHNTYSFDYCTGLCITAFVRTVTQGGVLTIERLVKI